jgi:hypothetical protein
MNERGGGLVYLDRSPASGKRRRKGNPVPWVYWATLLLGIIITGTWPSRLGESQMRVKMAVSSVGLGPKSDCFGKTQKQLYI